MLCVVCCFLCVHVVLCRCVCCVVAWCCVVLACCREHVVVLVVRVVCGVVCVWCVCVCVCLVFGVVCVWFGVCVCETTHGGVLDMSTDEGERERGCLSLPFCPCFFLDFVLFLLLFSSLLSSFLLLSSLLSSFLFPSIQQTLYKTRINQHGVQLRDVIWRELHSTSFSARHVVTHVTILPSCPLLSLSSTTTTTSPYPKERELFITEIFPAKNLFLITV